MEQQAISNNARIYSEVEPISSGYETLVQTNDDGLYVLSVLVSGVHCAGCIQKIESSLAREQEVDASMLLSKNKCQKCLDLG